MQFLYSKISPVTETEFISVSQSEKLVRDRVTGLLLGLAAGDRIGGPTSMAMILAQSLVDREAFFEDDVLTGYVSWWKDKGFDTGTVSAKVFDHIDAGLAAEAATIKVHLDLDGQTAGCNPVHRNTPIAMCASLGDSELATIAHRETSLTHKHRIAGLVSASSVQLARLLIKGSNWKDALMVLDNTSPPAICDMLKNAKIDKISNGGYSADVFSAAVYFVSDSNSFDEALERAIDFSAENNFCAVLTGSLGGARWGASEISNSWFLGLSDLEKIKRTATNLANRW